MTISDSAVGFVIAAVILLAVPGPNTAFIVANSLAEGWKRGFATLIGLNAALAMQLSVVIVFLGNATNALEHIAAILRWIGVVAFAILGLLALRRTIRHRPVPIAPRHGSVIWQSFVLGIVNPTVFLFFAAFLPIFATVNQSVTVRLAAFAGTFLILAVLIDGLYAAIASRVRRWLDLCRAMRLNERATGAALLTAAVILAIGGAD